MKSQIVTSKNNNEELSPARWGLRFTESSNRLFFCAQMRIGRGDRTMIMLLQVYEDVSGGLTKSPFCGLQGPPEECRGSIQFICS